MLDKVFNNPDLILTQTRPNGDRQRSGNRRLIPINQAATVLLNLTATTAPTVNDDQTAGYAVLSQWLDTALKDLYVCLDASTGAAVWKKITP